MPEGGTHHGSRPPARPGSSALLPPAPLPAHPQLSDWTILISGAWLVASPWVLGLQNTEVCDGAHVFDVAAGAVLLVLGAVSMSLRVLLHRKENNA
ncbi:SPW repeat protein [Streptomyces fulvorobeus]|uniref:SPW repeat protein n=1 Tax=Streptomyces fulvorobeus TaxID=284028 RepID=UPI0015652FA5